MDAMTMEKRKKWVKYMKGEIKWEDFNKPIPPPHAYFEPIDKHDRWEKC